LKTTITIAWKNIWRTKRRSLAVIGAIALGVWALIFLFSFLNSFNETYVTNAIKYELSHVQIFHQDYRSEPELKNYLPDDQEIAQWLRAQPHVANFSARILVNGMVASSKATQGIQITGIDPNAEAAVTSLDELLLEGTYFTEINRNPILVSRKIADKLKLAVRSKVVLTFQDKHRNITAGAFRVEGIFESKSPRVNEGFVYVRDKDLSSLIQLTRVHQMAVLLKNEKEIAKFLADAPLWNKVNLLSYEELSPEFNLLKQQSRISKQVLTLIIMLALLFGIINTMLMAVLERTREIGMLRAIGMNKYRVFQLFMIETVFLSIVGGPIGLVLGALTNRYFGIHGMDLSRYSAPLRELGYDAIFYPVLDQIFYPILMVVVVITAIIGALYPAYRAIQLKPVESLRKL
jgi:ABC-type lipoprotein release transport system permease subunit